MLQYYNILEVVVRVGGVSKLGLDLPDGLDCQLELLLLQHLCPVPLVDGLDRLLHPLLEVEVQRGEGELDVCDLITAKVDEVAIVRPVHFLAVEGDLVTHEGYELPAEGVEAFGREQEFGVCEDDEVVGSRILELLEAVLELLPLAVLQQAQQQSLGHADELFVGVVGRPFVAALPLADASHLLLRGLASHLQLHVAAWDTGKRTFLGGPPCMFLLQMCGIGALGQKIGICPPNRIINGDTAVIFSGVGPSVQFACSELRKSHEVYVCEQQNIICFKKDKNQFQECVRAVAERLQGESIFGGRTSFGRKYLLRRFPTFKICYWGRSTPQIIKRTHKSGNCCICCGRCFPSYVPMRCWV